MSLPFSHVLNLCGSADIPRISAVLLTKYHENEAELAGYRREIKLYFYAGQPI